MNVFVSGATGFIGSRLISSLVRKGFQVHALCRKSSDQSLLPRTNVKIFYGDILDPESVDQAMASCVYAFHLAALAKNWAPDPDVFYRINVQGTVNILEAARTHNIRRTVITSTCLTFGFSNGRPADEQSPRPVDYLTSYTRTKIQAEEMIKKYVAGGLDIRIVHPTRVFGPGVLSEANSVTEMTRLYLKGKWRLILGDGQAVGNYAYIDDVVEGHILAMEKGKPGESYLLGGESLSFNQLFMTIRKLSGRKHFLLHLPAKIADLFARFEMTRARLTGHYPLITPDWIALFLQDGAYSSRKAETTLGYRITPFKLAMQRTIFWLQLSGNQEENLI